MFALVGARSERFSPIFPTSFAQKGSRPSAHIEGLRDQGDWKANGTSEIAAEKTRAW